MNLIIERLIKVVEFIIVDSSLINLVSIAWLLKVNVKRDTTGIIIKDFMFNLNFSLDAILVMYINRISIPPIIIKNKIYEYQKL